MGKQIMVTSELYEALQRMKKGKKNSFTSVIESMMDKSTPRKQLLSAINDFTEELDSLIAHNGVSDFASVLRVTLLHCQSNPEDLDTLSTELAGVFEKVKKEKK